MQIVMSGKNQRFDFRDLAVAAVDSCRDSQSFRFHLLERTAVRLERRLLTREPLPALHHDINVFRVEFESVADALSEFSSGEGRSATEEWIVHELAAFGVT